MNPTSPSHLVIKMTSNDYILHIYFIIKNLEDYTNNFTLNVCVRNKRIYINDKLMYPDLVVISFKDSEILI